MNFIEIKTENDIKRLLNDFDCFHDSCIKELVYCSGGYVDNDGSMYPFNTERCVKIIFQSQRAKKRVIEMKFEKIVKLNLLPRDEEFDCIIYEGSLKKIGNIFYWSEWENFDLSDLEDDIGTWISSLKVSWRMLEDALGEEKKYEMR